MPRDEESPVFLDSSRAIDHASLLVDWGNELIGRSEVAGRAYGVIKG